MATGLVWHERYAWHDAGRASHNPWAEPYPALDRPESKRRLYSLLQASGLAESLVAIAPRMANEDELTRVHAEDYVARIRELSALGGGDAGESAWFGPDGFEVACLAAGGCIEAVDAVLDRRVENAYALVRPCGHHAEADRGRGFCIFGNVAIAARHAQDVWGLQRIAVIDWDVHHGNGTQAAFYEDPGVLTISLHQAGCYPVESGGLDETGVGAGLGTNLNLPLPPGSGHGAYVAAMARVVLPALRAFRPELIMVACGFDAAAGDPLGRMLCHSGTFREMARMVKDAAAQLCRGRLVLCHEGGYSPTYVPFCGLAVIEEMAGLRSEVSDPLLGWYGRLGGQELAPHQDQAIAAAERLLAGIAVTGRAA